MKANEEDEFVERVLWSTSECFVYRVPTRSSALERYRADTWGLDKPLLTARLSVVEKGSLCTVKLWNDENPDKPKLVCAAPICIEEEGPKSKLDFFVEAVADSSRYFVLRIEDKKTSRTALIGIGFRARDSAFSFQQSIQESIRFAKRQSKAMELQAALEKEVEEDGSMKPFVPSNKFALKEGQNVKVNIGISVEKKKKKKKKKKKAKGSLLGSNGGLLAPPPPPPSTSTTTTTPDTNEETNVALDEEEWGDFQ
eukprot:g4142.t1